jgi:polar amino acid transport system substrate-binding protein
MDNEEHPADKPDRAPEELPIETTEEPPIETTDFSKPTPATRFSRQLQAFTRPTYVRVILATVSLLLLLWAGMTMCSSPARLANNRYQVGLDPTWYPLQLRTREKNMTAFCETLLKELSGKLGVHIDIVYTATSKLFTDFDRGKLDGVLSSMLPAALEEENFITSQPLYRLGPVLVVNAKTPFKSLSEMNGKIVGLVGDARVDVNIDIYPELIFSGYNNISQAFADLSNRRIDGVIVDSLLAKSYAHVAKSYAHGLYADKFIISDFLLTNEGILLILHKTKDSERFIEKFDQELKHLREDGAYANFIKAWHVNEE